MMSVGFSAPWFAKAPLLGPLLIFAAVALREFIVAETHGRPQFVTGSGGNRVRPAKMLKRKTKGKTFHFGGVELDLSELLKNLLILGAVGAGKTLVLKKIMADVVPLIGRNKTWRALIIDPKFEFYSFLLSLIPSRQVKVIHPGDERGCAWNVARDMSTDIEAAAVIENLLPHEKHESGFWMEAARSLMCGIVRVFNERAPNEWRFSDLMFAAASKHRIKTLLCLYPDTKDILLGFSGDDRLFDNVFASISSRTRELVPVAAAWSEVLDNDASCKVSLKDWVDGNFLLLIGNDAANATIHARITRAILARASQLLLDGPTGQSLLSPATGRRTLVMVDEAARLGKLELFNLVTNGRDYGISVMLAAQSVEGLAQHYERAAFDALAAEFHTTGFLRVNSQVTAKWMSDRLSSVRDANGLWSPAVDPTYFLQLGQGRPIDPSHIPGIFSNSSLGSWFSEDGVKLPKSRFGVPQRKALKTSGTLRAWTDEDFTRLNLSDIKTKLNIENVPVSPPGKVADPNPKRRFKAI